jgi:phosphoglycolate phosphatase-like HAD superfamily hydrolase
MIEDNAQRFNIDVRRSFIIGDTTMDIQTGRNAGLGSVLVKTGQAGLDKKYEAKPDWTCENAEEGVRMILSMNPPPEN